RELKNIMERGVLIGKGPILEVEDLGIENNPAKTADTGFSPLTPGGIDLCSIEKTMERFYIKEALKMSGGNEIKAAKLLNLNHHTFRYRRKNLNISKIP
ncbi:MAG: helix-turn-helix domain-containing protein, partial [Thermodesulfobacteriota bacterium]|nr:helix-turn-helix domain-containing protein [Thermodesulfobacteriota bacterium]